MSEHERLQLQRLLLRCWLVPTFNGEKVIDWRYPLPVVSDIEIKTPKED